MGHFGGLGHTIQDTETQCEKIGQKQCFKKYWRKGRKFKSNAPFCLHKVESVSKIYPTDSKHKSTN